MHLESSGASQAAPRRGHKPGRFARQSGSTGHVCCSRAGQASGHRHPHPACNCHHRRKPHLRSHLCHLQTRRRRDVSTTCSRKASSTPTEPPAPTSRRRPKTKPTTIAPWATRTAPNNTEAYAKLPPVLAGGPTTPYLTSLDEAKHIETDLPNDYYVYMTTGGTGLTHGDVDTRIPHAASLPQRPFPDHVRHASL